MSLKGDYENCIYGCIFHMDKLSGDCRVPWSSQCAMQKRKKKYEEERVNARAHTDSSE